ncbi:esterase-like activity of phytase family protein [Roseibium algae]|uniref:Esterase-like activity of phytase family protein n=1 Tax=Roseibium algae TaxID=3123038 RepID=A0ABU8TNW5_9HYPH
MARSGFGKLAASALFCGLTLLNSSIVFGSDTVILSDATPVQVRTKQFDNFRIGRNTRTFGRVTFLGGLELISPDRNVGGLSGLLSLDHGNEILAVTDNGLWFSASLEQDSDSRPLGIENARYTPLLNAKGKTLRASWKHDTEAITLDGDSILVSAERANAIFRFPWPLATGKERMLEELPVSEQIRNLRSTKGLEAMAMAPEGTPLSGTLLAVAERGPSGSDELPGFLLKGGKQKTFSILRSERFDATDAAFLPSGDLLLLERRFNLRDLVGMRIRQFTADSIRQSARLKGKVLLEADYGDQIDNMEGLSVHIDTNGSTILTLLSDNNRSLLQRTLLLRFKLDASSPND